ncbi:MAG: transposase [Candidatus Magasanikbacteria bacterium]|nr:transposase [Candidatus Magasanikbacteria bacterium]
MSVENKYLHKYRIPSNRLPGYDYSSTGLYFVTICTKNREKYFGDVNKGVMELSSVGKIAEEELLKTAIIRPNIDIDTWVIMPNHVHLIIGIVGAPRGANVLANIVETPRRGVSTDTRTGGKRAEWKSNSLGSIINQFKMVCTKRIRPIESEFAWQSRFHDHVIRNQKSLINIRQYIKSNPEKWIEDEMYKI